MLVYTYCIYCMEHVTEYFSVRQHTAYMLSALYAIARPSVSPSVTRVDYTKMVVEVMVMEFPPYGSPIPLVFAG